VNVCKEQVNPKQCLTNDSVEHHLSTLGYRASYYVTFSKTLLQLSIGNVVCVG